MAQHVLIFTRNISILRTNFDQKPEETLYTTVKLAPFQSDTTNATPQALYLQLIIVKDQLGTMVVFSSARKAPWKLLVVGVSRASGTFLYKETNSSAHAPRNSSLYRNETLAHEPHTEQGVLLLVSFETT